MCRRNRCIYWPADLIARLRHVDKGLVSLYDDAGADDRLFAVKRLAVQLIFAEVLAIRKVGNGGS